MTALTIRDYYRRPEALKDNDRLIRIAALHHAKTHLDDGNEMIRKRIVGLLENPHEDALVRQYSAITLAQSSNLEIARHGVRFLLKLIVAAKERGQRRRLSDTLRNCARYPFAVLLNEMFRVETIESLAADNPWREFLENALTLNAEVFYDKLQTGRLDRARFLQALTQLDHLQDVQQHPDVGRACGLGRVLTLPKGKQPGFVAAPERHKFVLFYEDDLLNRDALEKGREVLFVEANQPDAVRADLVYVLEDSEAPERPLSIKEFRLCADSQALSPGVVLKLVENRKQVRAASIACVDGKCYGEAYRADTAARGKLALVEFGPDGKEVKQCHFVPIFPRAFPNSIRREVMVRHAERRGMALAEIVHIYEDAERLKNDASPGNANNDGEPECLLKIVSEDYRVKLCVPQPRRRSYVMLGPCEDCSGKGQIRCETCGGTKQIPCNGTAPCPMCKNTGKTRAGDCCPWCRGAKVIAGCDGQGVIDCPHCDANGAVHCRNCRGAGRRTCDKCKGSGKATCSCGGSGRYNGRMCSYCDGTGKWNCGTCRGAGGWQCDRCHATGRITCFLCQGEKRPSCKKCRGYKTMRCSAGCDWGKQKCPKCLGRRYFLVEKLEFPM